MINKAKKIIRNNKILYSMASKILSKKQNRDFRKFGRETLIDFQKGCNEAGIQIWLDFGTLLGAVREHNFIAHDFDIDTATFMENYNPNLKDILQKYGFKQKRVILVDDGDYAREETYRKNGVNIDIFYYKKSEQTMSCCAFLPFSPYTTLRASWENLNKVQVLEHTFPITKNLIPYDFLDHKFYIPENYDEHLRTHYGNYMVKDKNWHFRNAPDAKILEDKVGKVALWI